METVLFNIRMSEKQKTELEIVAARLDVSASVLMRGILFEGLARFKNVAATDIKKHADELKVMDIKARI